MHFIRGIVGIITVLAMGLALSVDRKNINLRTIGGALAIQLGFAFITLETAIGQTFLLWLSDAFQKIIDNAYDGIEFLFGNLVTGDGFIFAFETLGVVVFFSSLIAVLYYLGIMQWLVDKVGGLLAKLLGTTKAETLSATANIFMGQTEAPLVVKPYLAKMHDSELFAVMVGGFGSVAGSVLAGYAIMGIPLEYLLAASFMAAPSSLLMAKIVFPFPSDQRALSTDNFSFDATEQSTDEEAGSVIEAASDGAATGAQMAINIGATLLAFIALIALINSMIAGAGGLVGIENLSLERILGWILSPIMVLLGVPMEDVVTAGGLVGQKIVVNEFVAYADMSQQLEVLHPKSIMLLTFSLAGFGNLSGIASQIGGIGSLAPNRKKDISRLGMRAMLAGVLASLLNAAIAGMFF